MLDTLSSMMVPIVLGLCQLPRSTTLSPYVESTIEEAIVRNNNEALSAELIIISDTSSANYVGFLVLQLYLHSTTSTTPSHASV
jgi:hypothetical protein